jgi:predicted negative regulator of RcsB-dependent stress response
MGDIIDGVLQVTTWPQVVVVLGILGYLCYRAYQDGKKVEKVKDKVDEVEAQTALVAHEVQNNSGKSLRDVADRTETNTSDVLTAVQAVSDKLDAHLSVAVEESATLAEVKATTDDLRAKFLDAE